MRQMTRTDGSRLWQDKSSPSVSREVQQISEKVKVVAVDVATGKRNVVKNLAEILP